MAIFCGESMRQLDVEFSYFLDGNPILKSIRLQILPDSILLASGGDDTCFRLIGGILERAVPIMIPSEFGLLREITKVYAGDVALHAGELPSRALYVGPDPEHFLMMSTVDEEMRFRIPTNSDATRILSRFGLDDSFKSREFHELSGGEKVRVILSIALSMDYDVLILHGVVPWLDDVARVHLVQQLCGISGDHCVLLLENEVEPVLRSASRYMKWTGSTLTPTSEIELERALALDWVPQNGTTLNTTSSVVLEAVRFRGYPHSRTIDGADLIAGASFSLRSGEVNALLGPNGGGKSTIAKLVCGILQPDDGTISLGGKPIASYSRTELLRHITYLDQFPNRQLVLSTIGQYQEYCGRLGNELGTECLSFDSIGLRAETPVATLSIFQRKTLLLHSLTFLTTKLLILDEPSWGLSSVELSEFLETVNKKLSKTNASLLIITHDSRITRVFGASSAKRVNSTLALHRYCVPVSEQAEAD